ncbi:hypothetical protein NLX86_29620 [Streptomyces sp. A3M-1-3]|uniref:hypothetical protein n=1 Tax=Streptomyces sp. A3M-1-3 TaxID=2962044 RepID=UPI0020B88596|nr:hypothetical protein [Streptomyces sp. A3M-1-3]MCP3822097.1 hypothetical protein [Streptomyces sp. A3M-1-3]
MTSSARPPEITPDTTAPAEHERFAEYLHALAMVPDAEETALVAAVLWRSRRWSDTWTRGRRPCTETRNSPPGPGG